MKIAGNIFLYFILMVFANNVFADDAPGVWTPVLNFDIEDADFMTSLAFISGHSYALTATNEALLNSGKQNFFCCRGTIGSKMLVEILNENLSGVVTSEIVTQTIIDGLKEKFPCQ